MNPVTYARMSAGISKAELPRKLHISRTYVIRSEQGCYVRPSEVVVNFSCATLQISHTNFMKKYREFQHETRKNSVETKDIKPITIENFKPYKSPNQHPDSSDRPVGINTSHSGNVTINKRRIFMNDEFRKWRLNYYNSLINFAAALCIHPTSVENYEAGKYKTMPDQLEEVMLELGLMGDLIPDRMWVYSE